MGKNVFVAIPVIIAALIMLITVSYSLNKPDNVKSKNTYNAGTSMQVSSTDNFNKTPSSDIIIPSATAQGSKKELYEYIPPINFGETLVSFRQDNKETHLFSDVSYGEVENYVQQLENAGYSQLQKNTSQKKDLLECNYLNESTGIGVWLKYSETALSVLIYTQE